jgi:hypothetical protein
MWRIPYLFWLLAAQAAASFDPTAFQKFEIDVVFPRNDTYRLVSPFPVVFALQNPDAHTGFASELLWIVKCTNRTFITGDGGGTDSYQHKQLGFPDPYFDVGSLVVQDSDAKLHNYTDSCLLGWTFQYLTNCTYDGLTFTVGGTYDFMGGGIQFNFSSSGKTPAEALASYNDCPVEGGTINVSNTTYDSNCPHIDNRNNRPSASPCAAKPVGALATRLMEQLPQPTTTYSYLPASTSAALTSSSPTTTPSSTAQKGSTCRNEPRLDIARLLWTLGGLGALLIL